MENVMRVGKKQHVTRLPDCGNQADNQMEAWRIGPHGAPLSQDGERGGTRCAGSDATRANCQRPSKGPTPCSSWSTGKAEQTWEGSAQQSRDASRSSRAILITTRTAPHPGTVLMDGSQPKARPQQAAIAPAMAIERR